MRFMKKEKVLAKAKWLKKNISFISFIKNNLDHLVSINWLQEILKSSLNQLIYTFTTNRDGEKEIHYSIQATIDWYSTNDVHQLKPLPKPIKDAFWGCYKALFDEAGLPFNYSEQLQQFYNDGETPEPDINTLEFPRPTAPLLYEASNERKAIAQLNKPVFGIPAYTIEHTRLDKKVKAFCAKILEQYRQVKLSQYAFDKKCLSFLSKIEEEIDDLDSEDREALPEFMNGFASIFGLSQHVF